MMLAAVPVSTKLSGVLSRSVELDRVRLPPLNTPPLSRAVLCTTRELISVTLPP